MAEFDAYVICTSPRSGSTLLCDLLRTTGVAGQPASLFHRPDLRAWLDDYGIAPAPAAPERDLLRAVLAAALTRGRGDTGLFGLRLQRPSFPFLVAKLGVLFPDAPTDLARFEAAFGRTLFIHLTREDKVAQAVSLVRAEQTGLWHRAPDGTEIERSAPHSDPVYDSGAIRACHDRMQAFDRDWLAWFAAEGMAPLRLTYNDLSADPRVALARVLTALGRDPAVAKSVRPGIARLADATSSDWIRRFRTDP